MPNTLRILDVGQCGIDGPRMMSLFKSKLAAHVDNASTADEARQMLQSGSYDIALINREFAADGSSGLDLIADLRRSGVDVPLMLVSDYEDAQAQAVKLGAQRGFGKSVLNDPATLEQIRSAARTSA